MLQGTQDHGAAEAPEETARLQVRKQRPHWPLSHNAPQAPALAPALLAVSREESGRRGAHTSGRAPGLNPAAARGRASRAVKGVAGRGQAGSLRSSSVLTVACWKEMEEGRKKSAENG